MPTLLRRLLTAAGAVVLLSAGLTGCASDARQFAITAPADGDTISGKVSLEAEADGRRVEFFVNGVWVAGDSTGPEFSAPWDTRAALDVRCSWSPGSMTRNGPRRSR
jgi:Bacterial Ig domain